MVDHHGKTQAVDHEMSTDPVIQNTVWVVFYEWIYTM